MTVRVHSFLCFAVVPAELSHVGLAIAAVRAGGIGILDWTRCVEPQTIEIALRNLTSLIAAAKNCSHAAGPRIGIRVRSGQVLSQSTADLLRNEAHWLILSGWGPADLGIDSSDCLSIAAAFLGDCLEQRLLLEVIEVKQLSWPSGSEPSDETPAPQGDFATSRTTVAGLVGRGHESGGWSSRDASFLLAQKLLAQTQLPVYVQGGIGVHTAAACRAAGAAGVVLDDQLWLMPESPLSEQAKSWLAKANGQEAILIGEQLGWGCRVFSRPGFGAISTLKSLADRLNFEIADADERVNVWQQEAQAYMGWWRSDGQQAVWPMGQAVGLAASFRQRYRTTGKLIQAIYQSPQTHLPLALAHPSLQESSPLACSHGTRYPLVQGPMTRVSDSAQFANRISESGGLPMLALALMKGDKVRQLLAEAHSLLGDRPWGVGILGFVPHQLRVEQLQVVREFKPKFALIAGGRPDQAMAMEADGIATYLHVPTAALLQLFLEQGARRFVFEGRECGGHIGPLSSLVLWESVIDILLSVSPEVAAEIHILFAGGIHDGRSAAMVAAMTAPLSELGISVGALMGTAYLFTEEAVASGAIVETFQQVALDCDATVGLETGPGHASRCALTPFAEEFYETRRSLQRQQQSPEDIKNSLEDLTLGRLRIASKGIVREGSDLRSVTVPEQEKNGMYMIGQVATLRSQVTTLPSLHEEISKGCQSYIAAACQALSDEAKALEHQPSPVAVDIAIVGIGTLLPQAQDAETFWYNIVEQVNALQEIPRDRWDWRLYFDSDRQARDKIYSHWGGFLEDVPFDPVQFGIPPNSLRSIEPMQLITLEVVRRALEDAGYGEGDFDRENTSVVLGAGGGVGDLGQQYAVRSGLPLVVENPHADVWERLPEWTEESFPGLLLNVAAGRVANRFDLGGSNYTVDAACASSLAAISLAVKDLESGRSNVAIAGGVDTVQNPLAYMCFSKTQALSPTGQPRPFDRAADGITISEGLAVVVLKRRADAERDGDRIYAVIKGVEGSSDGKALGMTAPRSQGQQLAMERVYQRAQVSPATVGLYEAHGTGTVAGDRAELETISAVLGDCQTAPNSCAIGSVKSLIGHTKAAAGVAGLIKAALSLYYRVRPGHGCVSQPLASITESGSPVCLLPEAQPWLSAAGHPRRAGASAFGFGGTNFHALLEEAPAVTPTPLGGSRWPQELLVWRCGDRDTLLAEIQSLSQALAAGATPQLNDLAYTCAQQFEQASGTSYLGIVAKDLSDLQAALQQAIERLQAEDTQAASEPLPLDITLNLHMPETPPKVAFIFPGQGAQYPNMGRAMSLYLCDLRAALETADRLLDGRFLKPLSQYILPPGAFEETDIAAQKRELTDTRIAQPAIGAIEMGLVALARRLGLMPAATCGHSYGEYAALYAASVISGETFLHLSAERGRIMAECAPEEEGAMAAVQATADEVETWLGETPAVVIANRNAPLQTVISGPREQVMALAERLNGEGVLARLLPVAGAFHSPLVEPARKVLAAIIDQMLLQPGSAPVYSNATAQPYPETPKAMRQQLAEHMVSPVNFVGQVEALYTAGMRVFLELGPKSTLGNLSAQILADRADATVVSLDRRGEGLTGLLRGLSQLAGAGVRVKLTELFGDRPVKTIALNRLVATTAQPPLPATAWLINGGSARPQSEAVGRTGQLPTLTLETAEAAVSQFASKGENYSKNGQRKAPLAISSMSELPDFEVRSQHLIQIALTPSNRSTLQPMLHSQNGSSGNGAMGTVTNGHIKSSPSTAYISSADSRLAAFESYQSTMQQFLLTQERVMGQFLSGQALPPSQLTPMPVAPPPLLSATPATSPTKPVDLPSPVPISRPISPIEVAAPVVAPPPLPTPTPAPTPTPVPTDIRTEVPAQSPAAVAAPAERMDDSLTSETLTQQLLELVSDRTGYPTDMLGLDKDIEAELGIDSIKRVEILGTLQKRLPEAVGTQLQGQMETLTRLKTLSAVVDSVLEIAQEADCLGKSPAAANALPRFRMQPVQVPLMPGAPALGLYLMTEDSLGVAPLVAQALEDKGAQVLRLPSALLQASEPGAHSLEQVVKAAGLEAVQGILHLAPLQMALPETLSDWKQQTQVATKALFELLQLCGEPLQAGQPMVMAVSGFGGQFNRANANKNPLSAASSGGHTGLLKTLCQEWPNVTCRTLDCDLTLAPEILSQQIVEEIGCPSGPVEIGRTATERLAFQTVVEPLTAEGEPTLTPTADWVMLVTGGHRGITAEVIKSFVVPGMTLVLVGRSPEPPAESAEMQKLDTPQQLRQQLLMQARAEGKSPTPAAIETALQKGLNARQTRENLAWFRQRSQVDYRAVDVSDGEAFGQLIDDIYQHYGRLDGVIHGAGAIADKLLLDKRRDLFNRVFDTKADSAFILQRKLRLDSLKLLVFFSSVAGRYGSRGQSDYAAANEVVNRLALQLHWQAPKTRVVSINWGPWDTTGMASAEVKRQFRQRGIIPIPLAAGCEFFCRELHYGDFGTVEVVAGEGPWADIDPVTVSAALRPARAAVGNDKPQARWPLIHQPPELQPNSTMTLLHTLALEGDRYLSDHYLDNKPVLPAAAAAEWLAEFVQAAWPDQTVTEIEALQVLRGVTVPEAGLTVKLCARASSHADPLSVSVLAELLEPETKRPYYRATVHLRPSFAAPVLSTAEPIQGQSLAPNTAYRNYLFHGPRFHLVTAIDRLSPAGVDAWVLTSQPNEFVAEATPQSAWLFDPGLVDTIPQLAIVWARVLHETTPLPTCIGHLVRYGNQPISGTRDRPLKLQLRIRTFDAARLSYDAYISDTDGVRLAVTGIEGTCSAALNRLAQKTSLSN